MPISPQVSKSYQASLMSSYQLPKSSTNAYAISESVWDHRGAAEQYVGAPLQPK